MRLLSPLFFFLGVALAAAFAAFTVEPAGDQVVDLATGVTTLPDGGRLVDAETGLALEAPFIAYQEGVFVRAKKARLTTEKAHFFAEKLDYDVKKGVARLEGGVRLDSPWIEGLKAPGGRYYPEPGVAVLEGGVAAKKPDFAAKTLVADLKKRLALLLGEFRFADPELGVVLKGKGKNARLLLVFDEKGGVSAETEVPEDLYKRLTAFLKED